MHAEHFLKRMHPEVSNKRVTWSFHLFFCKKCFLSNIQHHHICRERSCTEGSSLDKTTCHSNNYLCNEHLKNHPGVMILV